MSNQAFLFIYNKSIIALLISLVFNNPQALRLDDTHHPDHHRRVRARQTLKTIAQEKSHWSSTMTPPTGLEHLQDLSRASSDPIGPISSRILPSKGILIGLRFYWTDQFENNSVYGHSDWPDQFELTTFLERSHWIGQFDSSTYLDRSYWLDKFDPHTFLERFYWLDQIHSSTFLECSHWFINLDWFEHSHWLINLDWFLQNSDQFPELVQKPEASPILENLEFAPKLASRQYFAPTFILAISELLICNQNWY